MREQPPSVSIMQMSWQFDSHEERGYVEFREDPSMVRRMLSARAC